MFRIFEILSKKSVYFSVRFVWMVKRTELLYCVYMDIILLVEVNKLEYIFLVFIVSSRDVIEARMSSYVEGYLLNRHISYDLKHKIKESMTQRRYFVMINVFL